MKRVFVRVLTCVIIVALGIITPVEAKASGNVSITVNGNAINASYEPIWDDTGTRILIPADFFSEHLNAQVNTDEQTTVVTKNGHTLSFKEGETHFVMDEIGGRRLESPIKTQNGIMYLPLRFVCEAFNADVHWDQETLSASITTSSLSLPDSIKPYFEDVTVFDQSTIRFGGDTVIYVDPYTIVGEPHDADVILVTHTHNDHFNIESIKKVIKDTTILLVTADGVEKAKENGFENVTAVVPNEEYNPCGITVKTIPAYNTSKPNHKKENNFVGYIITYNDKTYYAAGDTDYIPDMDGLDVDVAFLPIDGRFNMEETEAARAANAIASKIAVPYHYNNFSTDEKAQIFVSLLDENIYGMLATFKMYDTNSD